MVAKLGSKIALALAIVLMMWHGAWAQNVTCTSAFMTLSPCLQRVNVNSTKLPTKPSKPSSACCSSLNSVLESQPQCMCMLINGGGPTAGFAMSQTLAMALPAACNMQSPPISQCESPASPPSAPVGNPSSNNTPPISPSNDTPDDTSDTDTPSTTGPGSELFPWLNRGSSDAITIKSSLPMTILLVLIVSFGFRVVDECC